MPFQIPQFIEKESKIFGPFTFKQFIAVGVVGLVIFILYFTLAKVNFLLFLAISLVLAVGSLVLAFGQVGGKSLPAVTADFFVFLFSSRIYLWKRKEVSPKMIKIERKPAKKEVDEEPVLKITNRGRLEKLSTEIETRTK